MHGTEAAHWKAAASYIAHNPVLSESLDCISNNSFSHAQPKLISAAVRCFVMQRFARMCYADATNRVLKEQSMVVRRTEKREFGLATGWSDEDGTTTTYQPFARSGGSHRRIETGTVPRNVQQRTAAPASLYARRPSGVQPKVATPWLDDYEMIELDELDLRENPFAPRRSAASVSVWNVLGFAALFASVLIGRVIVDAGQNHGRTGAKQAHTVEAPQPSAAATSGSAGVGPEAQRNAAALDPDLTAANPNPASAGSATDAAKPATPNTGAKPGGSVDSATGAAKAAGPSANAPSSTVAAGTTDNKKSDARNANAASAALSGTPGSASSAKPELAGGAALPGSDRGRSADSQLTAAAPNAQSRSSQPRAASSDGRGGAAEPATTPSSNWRDGPMEPATTNARAPSSNWRDGPMEPATTNARTPSTDWRDGPMDPATNSSAPPTASPAAGKAALGTLRINSRPWSQIFIDGRLVGNTPQMAISVPAGRYTVRLSNSELGMSKTIIVQVAAGELVTRVESLE